ncbi:MAG TPA: FAD-binding oxidoreductase [Candidatus Limnocylindrales bacterium]|nr:FAD-binding oxidoreductase [Candidatus Limnocylindrales bacterium]
MRPSVMRRHPAEDRLGPRLLAPGDAGYDAARGVWNGMINHRPALIARVRSAEEVTLVLDLARERDLPVSIRGGGHNVAGLAVGEGSLVVDLSEMTAVTVDPERRRARVAGGARWRDVDAAAQVHGLATPGGVVSDTGVAGLTLSGGLGWLRRKHGLAADALVSAEVVTADGRVLRASATDHPDLFWGLRGGGGNFGVVTEFEFELYPLGPIVATTVAVYPLADAAARLRDLRELAPALPDEVSPLIVLSPVPDDPAFPTEVRGGEALLVLAAAAAPLEEGAGLLAPLAALGGGAIGDAGGPAPWVEWQQFFDADYPAGTMRYYWKSSYADELPDATIERLVELFERRPSHHSTIDIWPNLGAISRVPAEATAYGRRDAPWLVSPESNWEDAADDAANIAWGRDVVAAVGGGAYLNFPGLLEEGEALVRGSHGSGFERLARVKRDYDPENRFRFNANVLPAAD